MPKAHPVSPAPEGATVLTNQGAGQAGLTPVPADAVQGDPRPKEPRAGLSADHLALPRLWPKRPAERDPAEGRGRTWPAVRGGAVGAGHSGSSQSGPQATRQSRGVPAPEEQPTGKRKAGAQSRGRLGRPSRPVPAGQQGAQSYRGGRLGSTRDPGNLLTSQGRLRTWPLPPRRCKETQGLSWRRRVREGGLRPPGGRRGETPAAGASSGEQETRPRGPAPVPRAARGPRGRSLGRSGGGRLAEAARCTRRPGRRSHTKLSAINKTFIQTTAVQGTLQSLKKKKKEKGKETGKIFSALYIFIQVLQFCVYIHPLSTESPGFEIC